MVSRKMPVVIKCKSCGKVIRELNAKQLASFNILMLNFRKCKNCGHVFNLGEAELSISAISQNINNKFHAYILTNSIKDKLVGHNSKNFRNKLKCDMCGVEFKVGEKIVSLHRSRHTRRFHEKCYKKLMKKEFFVSQLKLSAPKSEVE